MIIVIMIITTMFMVLLFVMVHLLRFKTVHQIHLISENSAELICKMRSVVMLCVCWFVYSTYSGERRLNKKGTKQTT